MPHESDITDAIYIGFWKRLLMRIIDFLVLFIPIGLLYRFAVNESVKYDSVWPYAVMYLILSAFYVIVVSIYGGTPGKLLMKAKIVDKYGNKLSIQRSILRSIFYILYAFVMVFVFSDETLNQISSPYRIFAELLGVISILSDLTVVFNKRKKALHDFVAGSVVIKNSV